MSVVQKDEAETCLTYLPEIGFSLGVSVIDRGALWAVHSSGWPGRGTRTCTRYLVF